MSKLNAVKMKGAFRVKKAVTLPIVKLAAGVARYVFFDGPMRIGKDTGQVMNGKKMEPATIADVTDLETGEQGQLICATVLAGNLRETYPDDSYVGKRFAITLIKVPEKKYNLYEILEIEEDDGDGDGGGVHDTSHSYREAVANVSAKDVAAIKGAVNAGKK